MAVVTCGQNQWWLRRSGRQLFPDVDIFLPPLVDHVLKVRAASFSEEETSSFLC